MQQHRAAHALNHYLPLIWPLLFLAVLSTSPVFAEDLSDAQLDLTIDRVVLPIKANDQALAQDTPYGYRHITQKRQINLMLYGVEDGAPPPKADTQNKQPALVNLINQQWAQLKARQDLTKHAGTWQMQWGGKTFLPQTAYQTAEDDAQGQTIKPPKFVGAATQKGRWSYGVGYTWDEDNKAYMVDKRQGWLVGTGYQGNTNLWQATYLHTSDSSFSLPGSGGSGDQITLQMQRQVYSRPITTNLQYLHNQRLQDMLLDDTAMLTVGTQWKF